MILPAAESTFVRAASCALPATRAATMGVHSYQISSRAPLSSLASPQPARHRRANAPAWWLAGPAESRRGFSKATSSNSPLKRYQELCSSGDINRDARQEQVVKLLDAMASKVVGYAPSGRGPMRMTLAAGAPIAQVPSGGGWLSGLFGSTAPAAPPKTVEPPRLLPTGPKGLYIWGGCGTGKTFLMDLFFNEVQVTKKKRIHFHEWMIDVHERLHRLQKKNSMVKDKANTVWTAEAAKAQRQQLKSGVGDSQTSADDLVAQVAAEMMDEAWLLCFDEFQVTHISDAIIMKRLFSVLWEKGAVVIATSNRPPEDLYLNGLNRPLFLPFIPMIRDFCDVHDIASQVDYRLTTTSEEEDRRVYITPLGNQESKLLERKFYRIAHGEVVSGGRVETQGRNILVPKAARGSNVAWFRFQDLCDKPLGAGDYLAIASAFHTVFISDIPRLTCQERDQVRRFITLIDAFYERHTKLVCTAAADPITLFHFTEDEKKNSVFDEIFAWDRTASRLIEMQSVKYLSELARSLDGEQFLGQYNMRALNDEDLRDLWRRYDRDDSGAMDPGEVRFFLEDILETQQGHRYLSDETFTFAMQKMDVDNDGFINFNEFTKSMREFDLGIDFKNSA